jgi:hypothetical protein
MDVASLRLVLPEASQNQYPREKPQEVAAGPYLLFTANYVCNIDHPRDIDTPTMRQTVVLCTATGGPRREQSRYVRRMYSGYPFMGRPIIEAIK